MPGAPTIQRIDEIKEGQGTSKPRQATGQVDKLLLLSIRNCCSTPDIDTASLSQDHNSPIPFFALQSYVLVFLLDHIGENPFEY